MEVRIQVHKQVNALRIYNTIWKKVKGDLFLFFLFFLFLQCRRWDLNRGPLVQTTSVLIHSTRLPPEEHHISSRLNEFCDIILGTWLASICKTCIGKCETEFYKCSHFHNSDKDLCEFCPIRQNLWSQNLHQKLIFTKLYAIVHILI
jgi:hypothetical protein